MDSRPSYLSTKILTYQHLRIVVHSEHFLSLRRFQNRKAYQLEIQLRAYITPNSTYARKHTNDSTLE